MVHKIIKYLFIRYGVYFKGSSGSKKALLSFIVHPLYFKGNKHPNTIELISIINSLTDLGYKITIVDYRRKKIFGKYDLVIGFGDCYEYALTENIGDKYVLYSTGSPAFIQNQNAIESLHRFRLSNDDLKVFLSSKYIRTTENLWINQLTNSDSVITIGNVYIKSLFEKFSSQVHCIPSTCFDTQVKEVDFPVLDIDTNSFIWFGGKGCIHKGLDLSIDAAISMKVKLYIVGPLDDEIEIFREKLIKYPNYLFYIGFLSVDSLEFHNIANKTPFAILPSCSEGMATSIVTLAYNYGTIPLVTKQCGLDIESDIIEIEKLDLISVKKSMSSALSLDINEICDRKKSIRMRYQKLHNNREFQKNFESALKSIVFR